MYKLIMLCVAAIPIILFLRTIVGKSKVLKVAVSDLKKHIDYLVWVILAGIGFAIVISVGKLIYSMWT